MKMFVTLISGALLSSAALAQHEHGASTGGNETAAEAREPAGEAVNAGSNAAPAAEEAGERRICRRIDRTGSRMGRDQVCMTARQWREHNRND